jgi:hypothetical protein
VSLAGFAFQACSFNHSDISPFGINELRTILNSVAQNRPSNLAGLAMRLEINGLRVHQDRSTLGIVSDLSI